MVMEKVPEIKACDAITATTVASTTKGITAQS
jgi:hypothetical protein